ncbi:MAG: phosphomethylpyrimidine synthase ThiC, partial [Psychrobacter sp.]
MTTSTVPPKTQQNAADKKADALKTPAHRNQQDTRFEEDARDLHRILPASRKVYIQGSRPDIQVPMREITLDSTPIQGVDESDWEQNPPFYVYDTSGVYTDPNVDIDLTRGLPKLREGWIAERGDTEQLSGLSSSYGQARARDITTANLRFAHIDKPRRAKSSEGKAGNVTQMYYARRGIITPEMEYIAIRETQKQHELTDMRQHDGESFGANTPKVITPEFVR